MWRQLSGGWLLMARRQSANVGVAGGCGMRPRLNVFGIGISGVSAASASARRYRQ